MEGQAVVSGGPGQARLGNLREHALDEVVAQCGELFVRSGVEARLRYLRGLAEAYYRGDVLRTGAKAELLPAAVQRRYQLYPPAHVEGAYPLRAVHLMRRHRQHVDGKLLDVDFYMPRGLHRVAVEHHAVPAAYLAELLYRLDSAYLVVREHDRD